jgi:phosphopentomutase
MSRAFILVADSMGIGAAPDADKFGDVGADTFGHIAEECAAGRADVDGLRSGPLNIPNLTRLGLAHAAAGSRGAFPAGLDDSAAPEAAYGYASEKSVGKDTPSGHWEIAGLPVEYDWGYFPRTVPCFPADVIAALVGQCDLPGILGDRHASGTQIIEELGEEHIETGKPICYTSADSVFQIAAHETHFGLDRLYEVCAVAEQILKPLSIGRVIARPFLGEDPATFRRTANRRDLTTPPHGETLLDRIAAGGHEVVSVGKISDIFAARGISRTVKAGDTDGLFDLMLHEAGVAEDGALVFVNFVDFDSLFGHRRNVSGYAAEIEKLDARLPEFEAVMRPDDIAVLTADHGCDPTWPGSDHTRENVPFILFGPGIGARDLGRRESFADIGQSIASHLGLQPLNHGTSCF